MPIWLRKFIFNNIQNFYLKEQEDYKKSQQIAKNKRKDTTSIDMGNTNKIKIPDFVKKPPNYSSTVSKNPKK
tara:strand:+ start:290 stop:505 length:216 start_codon:yes stop_codon:yes gene_type:complete